MPASTTVKPAANGKRSSRKCDACGLTGKHAPNCKHSLQPSQVDNCAHADLRPTTVDGSTVWVCVNCGSEQKVGANSQPEAGDKIVTTVDGKEATVVIDGTTGAPVQAPMIETDIHEIELGIAKAYGVLQERDTEKKAATKAHTEAQVALNGLVAELTRRINGEQPLPFSNEPAATESDDDDEDDGE